MLVANLLEVLEFAHMSRGNSAGRDLQSILLPDVKFHERVVQSKIDMHKCFDTLEKIE